MQLKSTINGIFLIVIMVFVVHFSYGQQVLDQIVKRGEIRIGMSGSQPPFSVESKTGELIGFEVDLAKMLASSMGLELKIVRLPFPELLGALNDGKVDAVMSGMTITPERNLKAAFVGPYTLSGKSILTKSKTLSSAQQAQEINHTSIKLVALEGSTSQTFAEQAMPESQLILTKDYDAAVKLILAGGADALVADYPICAYTILKYPNEGLVTLNKPLTIEPIGMALPPGDPLLINLIENYFAALQIAGILNQEQQQWFETGAWLLQVK